ncbi:hypothetical protein O0L34_g13209 [Tuta absoluta]|nr:hypothetical protein O0L34_g13209 [Tuta absoluta]
MGSIVPYEGMSRSVPRNEWAAAALPMSGGRLVPGAGKETMEAAYELAKLSRYLTLIHMMCYDYHGTWDGVVGANAPLASAEQNDVLTVVTYFLLSNIEWQLRSLCVNGQHRSL